MAVGLGVPHFDVQGVSQVFHDICLEQLCIFNVLPDIRLGSNALCANARAGVKQYLSTMANGSSTCHESCWAFSPRALRHPAMNAAADRYDDSADRGTKDPHSSSIQACSCSTRRAVHSFFVTVASDLSTLSLRVAQGPTSASWRPPTASIADVQSRSN